MSNDIEAEVARLAVVFLRALSGLDQRRFAKSAGIDQRDVSRYETAGRIPRPQTLQKLARVAGLSAARLGILLEAFRQTVVERNVSLQGWRSPGDPGETRSDRDEIERLTQEVVERFTGTLKATLNALFEAAGQSPAPVPTEVRAAAEHTWARFQEIPAGHHRFVIQHGREYRTWAFCERLCAASAGLTDSVAARNLAELAVHVAEQPAGPPGPRRRLQGYAWGFVAQARRRLDDFKGSEEARERASELWAEGEASASEPLDEDKWLSLVVGLRPN